MEIRPLVKEDYPGAVGLIAEFAEEAFSEYGTYLELEKLQQTFDSGFETSFGAFIDGKMVGVFGGRIVDDLCSGAPVYHEMIWFVNKDHRTQGMKLFRHAMRWCKEQGITRMLMIALHNSKTDVLFKLYERLGFKPMETHFIKEID